MQQYDDHRGPGAHGSHRGRVGLLLGAGLLLLSSASLAHEFSPLLRAKKYAEADLAASHRLAADPGNADALVTKINVITAQQIENRIDEAVKLAELCVAQHPKKSECHESLGDALGVKAIVGGVMGALGFAHKIRDAYLTSISLDPRNFGARYSLLMYYRQAPMLVGGSTSKARSLVAESEAIHPDAGKILQARMDLDDDRLLPAESGALAASAGDSDGLRRAQRDILAGIANKYGAAKRYAEADRVFREVQQRFPESYAGAYGLGRTLQEQGRCNEAVPVFEQALQRELRAIIHYRIGQCWQTLRDKNKAILAFEKAAQMQPALSAKLKADADEQLKTLRH